MGKKIRSILGAVAVGATVISLAACGGGNQQASNGKQKIYLNLSYSGNNWQDEAANLALSIAKAPENAEKYDVVKQISGTDVQKQISDLQSMIASGAKLIVSYPISPTALDSVVKQGCQRGVTFVFYDSTVNADCAYNVAFITGARVDDPQKAFFGAQTAQALVDLLHEKGKIFMNRGVPGTATDTVHYDTAKAVFDRYPGIKVVSEFYGKWDSSVSQQETAKALAAHPDVDGIWSQDGEAGVLKALEAAGKKIPVTGENSNYFRQRLSEGWPGISSGSPPAQAGVAMKVGLKILQDGPDSVPKNIEMPLPWVTTETAKACKGSEFANGCNFFPQANDTFVTEIFQKDLLPESSLDSAKSGKPAAKVQPLPDMSKFAQPESRRIYTRGSCDPGWVEGRVTEGQEPSGLRGCVKQ
ncbi:sugar ABC transporter substrate-binding protein [Arthrobacter sp. GCM10027362]|uniref:sugar ABC transporter substrate-binding protein n=1 Tax=Arthrobacter sp. GCM10027362 TaxID=3273379 RepID=UPI00362D325C